jgi:hypothetical protein
MKRTIHILFWFSLVTALVVFLLRWGKKDEVPSATQPQPYSVGAAAVPALVPQVRPPRFVTPDAGSAPPADPEITAEALLMKQIRDQYRTNPAQAIEAAREARQKFGDSRDSDERDSLLIQAHLNLRDMASARAEMPYYYRHHPHGRWGDYLFALTNVGPEPAEPPK